MNRALILGGSCQLALDLVPRLLEKQIQPLLTYRTVGRREHIRSYLAPYADRIELIHLDFADTATLCHLTPFLQPAPGYLVDFAHSDFECLVGSATDEAVSVYFSTNISFRAMLMQRVARAMLANRCGRLVLISSTAAICPNPGQGFYAAAKLAAEALYRNIGVEMSAKGISSAIIRPGYIAAGRGQRYLDKDPRKMRLLKKAGQIVAGHDIIEALLFLLLTTGTSVNGAVLTLDGGMTSGKHQQRDVST